MLNACVVSAMPLNKYAFKPSKIAFRFKLEKNKNVIWGDLLAWEYLYKPWIVPKESYKSGKADLIIKNKYFLMLSFLWPTKNLNFVSKILFDKWSSSPIELLVKALCLFLVIIKWKPSKTTSPWIKCQHQSFLCLLILLHKHYLISLIILQLHFYFFEKSIFWSL